MLTGRYPTVSIEIFNLPRFLRRSLLYYIVHSPAQAIRERLLLTKVAQLFKSDPKISAMRKLCGYSPIESPPYNGNRGRSMPVVKVWVWLFHKLYLDSFLPSYVVKSHESYALQRTQKVLAYDVNLLLKSIFPVDSNVCSVYGKNYHTAVRAKIASNCTYVLFRIISKLAMEDTPYSVTYFLLCGRFCTTRNTILKLANWCYQQLKTFYVRWVYLKAVLMFAYRHTLRFKTRNNFFFHVAGTSLRSPKVGAPIQRIPSRRLLIECSTTAL